MSPGDLFIITCPRQLRIWPMSPGMVTRPVEVGEKFLLHSIRRDATNPDDATAILLDMCGNRWMTELYGFAGDAELLWSPK